MMNFFTAGISSASFTDIMTMSAVGISIIIGMIIIIMMNAIGKCGEADSL